VAWQICHASEHPRFYIGPSEWMDYRRLDRYDLIIFILVYGIEPFSDSHLCLPFHFPYAFYIQSFFADYNRNSYIDRDYCREYNSEVTVEKLKKNFIEDYYKNKDTKSELI